MKITLQIGYKTASAIVRQNDTFPLDDALSRAAAKIGWRGGAWSTDKNQGLCSVTKKSARGTNARETRNAVYSIS